MTERGASRYLDFPSFFPCSISKCDEYPPYVECRNSFSSHGFGLASYSQDKFIIITLSGDYLEEITQGKNPTDKIEDKFYQ